MLDISVIRRAEDLLNRQAYLTALAASSPTTSEKTLLALKEAFLPFTETYKKSETAKMVDMVKHLDKTQYTIRGTPFGPTVTIQQAR